MHWNKNTKEQWICHVPPDEKFRLEVTPMGDGRWQWEVYAHGADNPMAYGIARNLNTAKNVTEQFVARNS